jgi:hypothetical protein
MSPLELLLDRSLPSRAPSPEAFVDSLLAEATSSAAVTHPWVDALGRRTHRAPGVALALLFRELEPYARGFVGLLDLAAEALQGTAHAGALRANREEEQGGYSAEDLVTLRAAGIDPAWVEGIEHRELFLRLRRALGIPDRVGPETDAAQRYCAGLARILRRGAPEAVGALGLGTEAIVSTLYSRLLAAFPGLGVPLRARVFLDLHCVVDDEHAEVLRALAVELAGTARGRRGLARGMRAALRLRAELWDRLAELDASSLHPLEVA